MQKNLGRGSGPAVMQLGRRRVTLYCTVLYCTVRCHAAGPGPGRSVPYRGVPILFAVFAATAAAFHLGLLAVIICLIFQSVENFVRFSSVFAHFVSPSKCEYVETRLCPAALLHSPGEQQAHHSFMQICKK